MSVDIIPEDCMALLNQLESSIPNLKREIQSPEQVLITIRSPNKVFLAYVTVGVFLHEWEPPNYAITVEVFNVVKNEKMNEFVSNIMSSSESNGLTELKSICEKICSAFNEMDAVVDDECCGEEKPKILNSKKHKANNSGESSDSRNGKLSSMKTARDVINRIEWDENLPSENFLVGYMDRFLGVIERPFSSFDWSVDLCDVEQGKSPSAVPQHRIQYFKYKDVKVWDKDTRLDYVFGSTGDKKRIADVICEQGVDKFDMLAYASNCEKEEIVQDVYQVDWAKPPTDRLESCMDESIESDDHGYSVDETMEQSSEKAHKLTPNYFFAIRIDSPALRSYHDEFTTKYFHLHPDQRSSNRCSQGTLHITIGLLSILKVRQFELAIQMMSDISDLNLLSPLQLPFELSLENTLDCFHNRVAVIQVKSEHLQTLYQRLKELSAEYELNFVENYALFNPHITLVKFQGRTNQFDQSFLSASECPVVPQESLKVTEVLLCAMGERQEDGFYRVVSQFSVQAEGSN